MNVRFLLSSNLNNLRTAISGKRSATVEAEYGDDCVEGSVLTMAHHGPREHQPAPCSYKNGCLDLSKSEIEVVGLSHIDLDALAGCAAILGTKSEVEGFWKLVEFIELNGLHKIEKSTADEQDIKRFYAFSAWFKENKVRPNKDGSVSDVTDQVLKGIETINKVLKDDPELLQAGEKYYASLNKINKDSFVEYKEGVILRVSNYEISGYLYTTPDGKQAGAIVKFNPDDETIAVSFADKPKKITAPDILQRLFGKDAGGHIDRAGSPRNVCMSQGDLLLAYNATIEAVKVNSYHRLIDPLKK